MAETAFPYQNIHFVGIGGTGMNALAKILLARGRKVTGSDCSPSSVTGELEKMGARISRRQNGEYLSMDTELAVVSAAIKDDNPELVKARELGVPVKKYAQALGLLMKDRYGISICGTHGKTTITSMTSYMLREAGQDPTFVIGGSVRQLGGSSGVGKSDYFVAESCEFDRSFLNLYPRVIVMTNIEEDHLDYYKDIEDIKNAFSEFCANLQPGGVLIYCADCPRATEIAGRYTGKKVSYGFNAGADYRAENIDVRDGFYSFDVVERGGKLGSLTLSVPGWHNVENAVAVVAAGRELNLPADKILAPVAAFKGADRRFEVKGEFAGVTFIDDYAHHPTEIEAVLKTALARFHGRRMWTIFQPHQYSRTRFLLKDFAEKLLLSERVILPEIYFVRDSEQERQMVSAKHLAAKIRGMGGNAVFIPTLDEILIYLVNNLDEGDVVITMGAGDIWKLADELVRRVQSFSRI